MVLVSVFFGFSIGLGAGLLLNSVLSCPALSCLAVSCLVVSCLVWPCLVLSCLLKIAAVEGDDENDYEDYKRPPGIVSLLTSFMFFLRCLS